MNHIGFMAPCTLCGAGRIQASEHNMSKIIDGKLIAGKIEKQVAKQVAVLKRRGITPKLAFVMWGEDRPSKIYIKIKK